MRSFKSSDREVVGKVERKGQNDVQREGAIKSSSLN